MKAQDVVLAIKLASFAAQPLAYRMPISVRNISDLIGISKSEVSNSLHRLRNGHVLLNRQGYYTPSLSSLLEILGYGVPYFFPPEMSGQAQGIPTCFAATPLRGQLSISDSLPLVWASAYGKEAGIALKPLHPSVLNVISFPDGSLDNWVYKILALTDAIRTGAPRERTLARQLLSEQLKPNVPC